MTTAHSNALPHYPLLSQTWDNLRVLCRVPQKRAQYKNQIKVFALLAGVGFVLSTLVLGGLWASQIFDSGTVNSAPMHIRPFHEWGGNFKGVCYFTLMLAGCMGGGAWFNWKKLKQTPDLSRADEDYIGDYMQWRDAVKTTLAQHSLSELKEIQLKPDLSVWAKKLVDNAVETVERREFEQWKSLQDVVVQTNEPHGNSHVYTKMML